MNKLNPKAFGLACGVLWGGSVMLMGLLALVSRWTVAFVYLLSTVYLGYSVSIVGILIGGLWGFVDGFIGGAILAWLYNKFSG